MKRKKSNSSSPSRNSCLPLELLREILARLPAKTLIKFRCVSKTWCSLIDSSDFITWHHSNIIIMNMNSQNPQFLLATEWCTSSSPIITVRRSNSFRKIASFGSFKALSYVQSCYGLVMVISYKDSDIRLWNPSIRKCIILPPSGFKCATYHLGFAPSSNDFKVFASRYSEKVLAVYSLNDRRWRVNYYEKNGLSCVFRYNDNSYNKVVLNGTLPGLLNLHIHTRIVYCGRVMYWVDDWDDNNIGNLFSYDFDLEEFSSIQLPDAVKESVVWFFFAFGESIAVFTMSSEKSCIWVMAEVDNGEELWKLWFSGLPNSDVSNLLRPLSTYPIWPISSVQYLLNSNTFLIAYNNHKLQRKILMYNITSQEIQHLGKSIRGGLSFETYVESLVLHRGFEGHTFISFP